MALLGVLSAGSKGQDTLLIRLCLAEVIAHKMFKQSIIILEGIVQASVCADPSYIMQWYSCVLNAATGLWLLHCGVLLATFAYLKASRVYLHAQRSRLLRSLRSCQAGLGH